MPPLDLLEKYYPPGTVAHAVLLDHGRLVAAKAAEVADRLGEGVVDLAFVIEAAWLHDIGMLLTSAPALGCRGAHPYLAHGVLGRQLLEREGLPRHALVCERHIGVGLTAAEIAAERLPLPARDMLPVSAEEQIVAYADLFFSKTPERAGVERTPEQVRRSLARFGSEKSRIFDRWHERFGS